MLSRPLYVLTVFALLVVLTMPVTVTAQTEIIRKTDNFCLFVDHSASMKLDYKGMGSKIWVAKNLLADLNMEIPMLGYKSALYTFAPMAQYQIFLRYDRVDMLSAITRIDTDYSPIYNMRTTPIGDGLYDLAPMLEPLKGRISLILFTNGGQNTGRNPVTVARDLAGQYGDRLCIHVVSFAQSPEEQHVVEQISRVTPCGILASASDLQSAPVLEQFANDVFYDTQTRVVPEQPVEVLPSQEPVEEEPEMIVLRGVQFDFDKSDIKPEYVPVLDEAVAVLSARPEVRVRIEGHTCSIGTNAYNQGLSERRAAAVKNYLAGHGIAENRLDTVGYGESRPRFDNTTRQGRAKNRRVEMVVE